MGVIVSRHIGTKKDTQFIKIKNTEGQNYV